MPTTTLALVVDVNADKADDFDFAWLVELLESIELSTLHMAILFLFSGGDDIVRSH